MSIIYKRPQWSGGLNEPEPPTFRGYNSVERYRCKGKAFGLSVYSGVSRIWHTGAQNYMKQLFVADKMTQNNSLNKDRVAATELLQLLSQDTNMFVEATAQSCCQNLCSCDVN